LPQSQSSNLSSLSQNSSTQSIEINEDTTRQEGELYLSASCVIPRHDFDLLGWWKANECTYPRLARVAKDILSVPIAQVGVERVFNTAKDLIGDRRHRLAAQTIRKTMLLKHSISQELDNAVLPIEACTDSTQLLADEASDLFELSANVDAVESGEQHNQEDEESMDEISEGYGLEIASPLPPRKRARPARYRD
jgi:hypothetical protein